ncbi:hypothetical protein VQ643_01540 [Pseudomonas sp. F1_0610]
MLISVVILKPIRLTTIKNNVSNMGASTNAKDTVIGMRLAYGLAFPAPNGKNRAELEYSRNEKAKDFSWTTVKLGKKAESTFKYNVKTSIQNTWMVNDYYNFDTQTLFTPYVTANQSDIRRCRQRLDPCQQ